MKKSFFTFTILGVVASAAHAQSSVSLYGIVGASFVYSNNSSGQKQYQLATGALQGNRWGLRGVEDLGGGLNAIFVLENGFNGMTGALAQGGDEFGRQAFVGISSSRYGTVTLGRQYDSVVDFTGPLASSNQFGTSFNSHPGDLDNLNNNLRVNNAVKYASANYAGFSFGGLYSLGGIAGQYNRNQIWSLGAGYAQGSLTLGAAYLNVKDPNFSYFGNNASSSTTASNMSGSPVYSGYASAKTQQVISAGGAYKFGAATVGATYTNIAFKDLGTEAGLNPLRYSGSANFHNAEANFKYQLTQALLLGAAYDYTKGYGVNRAQYHQAALGAIYSLSKRTDLYLTGIYQHALGTDSTGKAAVADIYGLSASKTPNQVATIVGLRHRF